MILQQQRRAPRGAFTLMEMLVVVAIMVVLAGTGGVIYMRYLEDAKKSQAKVQLKLLSQVVDTYQLKFSDYPGSLAILAQPAPDGGKAFVEPSALIDPWGRPYQYANPGQHHTGTGRPDIWSQGPPSEGNTGIIGNW